MRVSDILSYKITYKPSDDLATIEVNIDIAPKDENESYRFSGPLHDTVFQASFWSSILHDLDAILPIKRIKEFADQSFRQKSELSINEALYSVEVTVDNSNLSVVLIDSIDAKREYCVRAVVPGLFTKKRPFENIWTVLYSGLLSEVYNHMILLLKDAVIQSRQLVQKFICKTVDEAVAVSILRITSVSRGEYLDSVSLHAVAAPPASTLTLLERIPTSSCLLRTSWFMSGCDLRDNENSRRVALALLHLIQANERQDEPVVNDHTIFLNSISLEENARTSVVKIDDELSGIFDIFDKELENLLVKDSMTPPRPLDELRSISNDPWILHNLISFTDLMLKVPFRNRGNESADVLLSLALLRSISVSPENNWESIAEQLFSSKQSFQFVEKVLKTVRRIDQSTSAYSALLLFLQHNEMSDLSPNQLNHLKLMSDMAYFAAENCAMYRKYKTDSKMAPKLKVYSSLDVDLKTALSLQYSEPFGNHLQALINKTVYEDIFRMFWVPEDTNATVAINNFKMLCSHIYFEKCGYLNSFQSTQYLLESLRMKTYSRGRSPRDLHIFSQFEVIDQNVLNHMAYVELCFCVKKLLCNIYDEIQDYSFVSIDDIILEYEADVEILLQFLRPTDEAEINSPPFDAEIFSFKDPSMSFATAHALIKNVNSFVNACQSYVTFVAMFRTSAMHADISVESSKISAILESLQETASSKDVYGLSSREKFVKWVEAILNAPLTDILTIMQNNICEVQMDKYNVVFDRELSDFYSNNLVDQNTAFIAEASEETFLVSVLKRLTTNELTDLSSKTIEKMNRIVFLLRLRKAVRGKKFFVPSDANGVKLTRKIQWGPLSVENIMCDFSIVATNQEIPLTLSDSPSKISSFQALQITENDTVEELLRIWHRYVRAPFEGLGSKEVSVCYHQLLQQSELVLIKIETINSIFNSSVPYCFDFVAFPPHLISYLNQQFLLMKMLCANGSMYRAVIEIEKDIDYSIITDTSTMHRIKELLVEFSSQRDADLQNALLSQYWFQYNDIFPFTIEIIKSLIHMDSMDLVTFIRDLTDAQTFITNICAVERTGLDLSSGFNWVIFNIYLMLIVYYFKLDTFWHKI